MIDDDYIARGGFMRIPGVRILNVLNNDGMTALSTSWPHPVDAVISLQDRRRTLKMFMDEPAGENVPVIGLPLKLDMITRITVIRNVVVFEKYSIYNGCVLSMDSEGSLTVRQA